MCLSSVDQKFSGTCEVIKTGWKIFEKVDGNLTFPHAHDYLSIKKIPKIIFGKWLTSTNGVAEGSHNEPYETGFHMCKTRDNARYLKSEYYTDSNFAIRKVRYKCVTAVGRQLGTDCVVAKKMMVLNVKG